MTVTAEPKPIKQLPNPEKAKRKLAEKTKEKPIQKPQQTCWETVEKPMAKKPVEQTD